MPLAALRGLWGFVKDLFKGNGNVFWELGRILTALSTAVLIYAAVYNMHLGQPIDLAALGGGLAGIITAGAILIGAKAWERRGQVPNDEAQ